MRRLLLAGLLAAGTELAGLGLLGTATWLIARAAQRPAIVALTVAIVAVRALAIAKGSLRYTERLAGHDAALRVLADVRTRAFAALAGKPADGAEGGGLARGDLLNRLVSDVDAVQDLLLRCALPAGVAGLVALVAIGFTAIVYPLAALIVAAGLLLAGGLLPVLSFAAAVRSGRRIARARGDYLTASVDVLAGAADLAAFGATRAALDRAGERATQVATWERNAGRAGSVVGAVGSLLPGLTAVGVCLVTLHHGPSIWVAVLSLVALGAVEAVLPLTGAAARYAELRGSWARVQALLADAPAVGKSPAGAKPDVTLGDSVQADGPEPARLPAGTPAGIRMHGVEVRYPGRVEAALAGIDLDLPAGRRVAIVGPSGAGKSTLLGVLAGAVRPTSGTAAAAAPLGWPLTGGVFSDGYLFHASVRENLTLGRPGFDQPEFDRALGTAGLPDWTNRLDEPVGEDGGQLSGGQRQRLLLARALLDPPPVLLLDEPTEGLHPAAADAVLADVLGATEGHSVVLVTHRLVDLGGFDEILVLADGRVAERGKHDELVARDGWYATWAAMSSGQDARGDPGA